MTPTVSVIIPTYNRAHLVVRAIRSVLAQSFDDWECVIVDDASTDNTRAVVLEFSDPRIRYVRHEVNRGGGAARNTGIAESTGRYVTFLDADDEYLPTKLAKQLRVLDSGAGGHISAILCGALEIHPDGAKSLQKSLTNHDIYQALLSLKYPGGNIQVMVRRNVVNSGCIFDENMVAYQDRDFVIRVAKHWRCSVVDEPLYRHYIGTPDRIYNRRNAAEGLRQLMAKIENELDDQPDLKWCYERKIATLYHAAGDVQNTRRHLFRAWRTRRRDVTGLILASFALTGQGGLTLGWRISSRMKHYVERLRTRTAFRQSTRS